MGSWYKLWQKFNLVRQFPVSREWKHCMVLSERIVLSNFSADQIIYPLSCELWCSIGEHAAIFSAQTRWVARLGGIMGRFFVICPVVRCNSKQSRTVTTHSSSKIVFCKFSGVCLKHSSLTTYHCVPRTSSADQSCRQRCKFFSED